MAPMILRISSILLFQSTGRFMATSLIEIRRDDCRSAECNDDARRKPKHHLNPRGGGYRCADGDHRAKCEYGVLLLGHVNITSSRT